MANFFSILHILKQGQPFFPKWILKYDTLLVSISID